MIYIIHKALIFLGLYNLLDLDVFMHFMKPFKMARTHRKFDAVIWRF